VPANSAASAEFSRSRCHIDTRAGRGADAQRTPCPPTRSCAGFHHGCIVWSCRLCAGARHRRSKPRVAATEAEIAVVTSDAAAAGMTAIRARRTGRTPQTRLPATPIAQPRRRVQRPPPIEAPITGSSDLCGVWSRDTDDVGCRL